MKTSRKYLMALCMVVAALIILSADSFAQGVKLGFVRDDFIKDNYAAWKRAEEQFEVERKAWDDEAQAMQTELQEMMTEYDKQKLILSEDKRREKEATILAKQEALDAFTRQIYSPGGKADKKQEQLIVPLLERVTKAIELVAIEGNYDVIFTLNSGLGYIKESYDVTDKVLEQLDQIEE